MSRQHSGGEPPRPSFYARGGAPQYDEDKQRNDKKYGDKKYGERYRNDLGGYYGVGGSGYRDDDLI